MQQSANTEAVARKIIAWDQDPILFVRENFGVEPEPKQAQFLRALPDTKIERISLQGAVNSKKTAALAWAAWWFLSVKGDAQDDPKGAAVSVSGDNLRDNLWTELSKWRDKSAFLKKAFTWTAERIFLNERPDTWWISARTWAKKSTAQEQGRTLSGLHSGYVLCLIDESGEIPPPVLRAAEQTLSDTNRKWTKVIQAGNPTSHHGMLYDAYRNHPDQWLIIRITGDPDDPERCPSIDPDVVRKAVEEHGRQDPWVMSQYFAEFPPSSMDSLFSPDELSDSQKRALQDGDFNWAQKRIGVDVALGGTDETAIAVRQGLYAQNIFTMRSDQPNEIAARVALEAIKFGAEAIFVDNTGGWGSGVVDHLKIARLPVVAVNSGQASDDKKYKNKRSEMWMRCRDWVRAGGVIPKDQVLVKEMCAPRYTFDSGKFVVEEKKNFKKRLGKSPDRADALCLTFAVAEAPSRMAVPMPGFRGKPLESSWDPFSEDRLNS